MILNNNYSAQMNNKNKTQQQTFGDAFTPVVAAATFIENNGFLGEFLTVDTFGMATPRTAQGLTRNKEELGHWNYKAGREEAVREVLSGPAFFFVPAGVIFTAALLRGKSVKVTPEALDAFKPVMQQASVKMSDMTDPKLVKEAFLDNFIGMVFDKKEFTQETEQISKIKGVLSDFADGKIKKKNALKEAEEALTTLNKANGKFIDDTAKIALGGKHFHISEMVTSVSDYLGHFTKDVKNSSGSMDGFIDKFHKKAALTRKIANVSAVAALSAFLLIMPKIYQTGKEFPGLDGLKTSEKTSAASERRSK